MVDFESDDVEDCFDESDEVSERFVSALSGVEKLREGMSVCESRGLCDGLSVSARVTILTPMPSSLVAGMKSVVDPSFPLIGIRDGWFEAVQPLSSDSVPVE